MGLSSSGIQFKPKKNRISSPAECIPTAGYRPPTGIYTDDLYKYDDFHFHGLSNPVRIYRKRINEWMNVAPNWNIKQCTKPQKLPSLTKHMTSNMIFLPILLLQCCYSPNFALAPSMHCLQHSLSLVLVFEACVPSNMMPSSLTPSSHLSLGFPTLLLLWIICCSTSFAIICSTIPII